MENMLQHTAACMHRTVELRCNCQLYNGEPRVYSNDPHFDFTRVIMNAAAAAWSLPSTRCRFLFESSARFVSLAGARSTRSNIVTRSYCVNPHAACSYALTSAKVMEQAAPSCGLPSSFRCLKYRLKSKLEVAIQNRLKNCTSQIKQHRTDSDVGSRTKKSFISVVLFPLLASL